MTGGGLEYDGDDGVRLFSRWRCHSALPSPRPFIPSPRQPPPPLRSRGCPRHSLQARLVSSNPRRPSVAAPLRTESRDGAAVAAAAADGDGLVRGVAQLPLESADVGSRFLQVARCGCAYVTRTRGTGTSVYCHCQWRRMRVLCIECKESTMLVVINRRTLVKD